MFRRPFDVAEHGRQIRAPPALCEVPPIGLPKALADLRGDIRVGINGGDHLAQAPEQLLRRLPGSRVPLALPLVSLQRLSPAGLGVRNHS